MQAVKIESSRQVRWWWLGTAGFVIGLIGYEVMLARLIIMVIFFALLSYEAVRGLAYVSLDWSVLLERLRQSDRGPTANPLTDPHLEYLRDLHRRGDG